MWPFFCFSISVFDLGIMNRIYRFIKKLSLLTCLLTMLFITGKAQGQPNAGINNALKAGDASDISRYFGPSVDITINNSTSTYSHKQGELVLRDFFNKVAVQDFDIEHSGNSAASPATFTIGYLKTSNGQYKVYMWLKPRDGGYVLKEIRFEK